MDDLPIEVDWMIMCSFRTIGFFFINTSIIYICMFEICIFVMCFDNIEKKCVLKGLLVNE